MGILVEYLTEYRNIIALIVTLITLQVILHYVNHPTRRPKMPPGPMGVPILGILPWVLYHRMFDYAWMLSKTYGKIINLVVGKFNIMIINDYEMAKEFSLHPDFQGRINSDFLHEISQGLGIVGSEGTLWKHQRRFTVQALKDAGMGKLHLQDKILDEVSKVFTEIDKFSGQCIDMHKILEKATCNIICALAFNKQYDYDDVELKKLMDGLNYNFKMVGYMQICGAFWWLMPIFKFFIGKKIYKNSHEFEEEAEKIIKFHEKTIDVDNPRDLIDLFIIEMQKADDSNEEKEYKTSFFKAQLIRMILDLFGAGTETSSTTLRWAILYMIHNPDMQRKVQEELDEVIGTERMPNMEDKHSLPYTVATIQEAERLGCVAPMSLARSNPKAASFKGFEFKPRQVFHFNLYGIHRDPRFFNEPEVFNPERYLEGGKVARPVHLMPFGSGKRMCPGESLAKAEVFLLFAALMHRYHFSAEDPKNLPSLRGTFGFVHGPVRYKVKVHKRF